MIKCKFRKQHDGGVALKPLKEKVSITIDSDIVAKLKERAEQDDRSFSQFVNKILKEYLSREQD